MALCDPNSYPQAPCTPESRLRTPRPASAPTAPPAERWRRLGVHGDAALPAGQRRRSSTRRSCDDTHWCAALTIDSPSAPPGSRGATGTARNRSTSPSSSRDGVPTGPPDPQESTSPRWRPNSETLLMNPGDPIRVHMFDARASGGGGDAFEVVIQDYTGHDGLHAGVRGERLRRHDLDGRLLGHAVQLPARVRHGGRGNNISPWAASATDISTEFETGHWEPCTSRHRRGNAYQPVRPLGHRRHLQRSADGPYENAASDNATAEAGDARVTTRAIRIRATTVRAPLPAGRGNRLPGQCLPER